MGVRVRRLLVAVAMSLPLTAGATGAVAGPSFAAGFGMDDTGRIRQSSISEGLAPPPRSSAGQWVRVRSALTPQLCRELGRELVGSGEASDFRCVRGGELTPFFSLYILVPTDR